MYKNQLRSIRKKQKISQARLMGMSGVNQTRISFIENGYIKGTSEERARLANALDLKTSEIFDIDQDCVQTP
jgi:transcriptional regulator with XRE-family HTH domain